MRIHCMWNLFSENAIMIYCFNGWQCPCKWYCTGWLLKRETFAGIAFNYHSKYVRKKVSRVSILARKKYLYSLQIFVPGLAVWLYMWACLFVDTTMMSEKFLVQTNVFFLNIYSIQTQHSSNKHKVNKIVVNKELTTRTLTEAVII